MKGVFGPGALNVGGHKISYGLLAALAGIAGAILLVIQLNRNQSSVGAGSPVYDPSALPGTAGFGSSGFGADYSGQLANIESSINALGSSSGTNGSGGSSVGGTRPPVATGRKGSTSTMAAIAGKVVANLPPVPGPYEKQIITGRFGGELQGPPLSRKPAQSI